jgi:hypothetical protein
MPLTKNDTALLRKKDPLLGKKKVVCFCNCRQASEAEQGGC